MNALVLVTDLENAVGGIATFNRLFVQALSGLSKRSTDSLTVLALHDQSSRSEASSIPANVAYQGFAGNRFRFCREAWSAGRRADRVFFGHVHLAPLVWGMSRPQKILIAHGLEVWRPLSGLRRRAVHRMDRLWAVSRYTAEQLMRVQGAEPERCVVFPNTLAQRLAPHPKGRDALGLRKGKILLTVSRLNAEEPYKQIDLVVEALPKLVAECPDLLYVVVGDGSDRSRLVAKSRALGVESHVVFTGAVAEDQLSYYYQTCDVFVLPSLEEGFGIVFLEAMAHAKPCVGAMAGGVPEVIVHDKTGLLTIPRDLESVTQALQRLLRDANLRKTMGDAGRQRLEEQFSFPRFSERLHRLLSEVPTLPALRVAA